MKKFALIGCAFMLSCISVFAQDRKLKSDELPKNIKEFVTKHYKDVPLRNAELDIDGNKMIYEIKLANHVEMGFDNFGKLIKIKDESGVKKNLLPITIVRYVDVNYSGSHIVKWDLEESKKIQEVKLNNNVELEFDLNGSFIRIDK